MAVAVAVVASAAAVTFTTPLNEMASARAGSDPPLIQPGQLRGRLLYIASSDCKLHAYDFGEAADSVVGVGAPCFAGQPDATNVVLSPNGKLAAERVTLAAGSPDHGRVGVFDTRTGKELWLSQRLVGKRPDGFSTSEPRFSYDGSRIMFCSYASGAIFTTVADSFTGRLIQQTPGSCSGAITRKGVAVALGSRVAIGQHVIFAAKAGTKLRSIAPDPDGRVLGVLVRNSPTAVELHVVRLDGTEVRNFLGFARGEIVALQLAPDVTSAVLRLSDTTTIATPSSLGRLKLHVHLPSGYLMGATTYSSDGRFLAAERFRSTSRGAVPGGIAIVDAHSFAELFRLPVDATAIVWQAT